MKYKQIEIKEIPSDLFQFEKAIIFEKNQGIFKLIDNLVEKIYSSNEYFVIEGFKYNKIYLRNKKELLILNANNIDDFSTLPLNFLNSIQIKNIELDFIILRNNFNNGNWKINKIDIQGKKIWEKNYDKPFNSYVVKSNLILNKIEDLSIEAIKLDDGTELWQQSFSSLLDENKVTISPNILEAGGLIYFILYGSGKKTCFGLDSTTGKVLKTIPDVTGDLMIENEFIYFLHSEIIKIFNTTNDQIVTWNIEKLMIDTGIDRLLFPRWAVNNGLVYFSQSKDSDIHSGNIGAKFGILDPIKKELIWQGQLPIKSGTIGEIKVHEDTIYLHTQHKSLFIFEKI